MRIQPDADGSSIVLVGSFNPRLFRPEWFAATEVVGAGAAASAAIDVIQENLTSFSFEWAKVVVQPNRFSVTTEMPPLVRIRDLVLKVFKELLTHTPIHQLGINRWCHAGSFEIRERVGTRLAPRDAWGQWGAKIAGSDKPELHGGMLSLTMTQRDCDDRYRGAINARVEPSGKVPLLRGIFVHINDHFELPDADKIVSSDGAMQIIEGQWDTSMARSEWIIDQVMALTESVR